MIRDIRRIFATGSGAIAHQPASPSATRGTAAEGSNGDQSDDHDAGSENGETTEEAGEGIHPAVATEDSFLGSEVGRFLSGLRPLLLGPRDRGKRLSTKGPDPFGGTFNSFRAFWEKLQDYLEINAPSV